MVVRVKIGELREGEIRRLDELNAIIVKVGGKVFAYIDECPHAGCSFSDAGRVEGKELICLCHYAKFDIESGKSLSPELTDKPLTPVPIRVEGDDVVVG